MQKIKRSFAAKLRNLLIVLLTLSMLLLAVLYIGGSQLAEGSAALRIEALPDDAVPVGQDAPTVQAIYEKGLLPVAFAGIRFQGEGGGTYGGEQAADALYDFAAEPIHLCLGATASLTEVSVADFAAAGTGDFLFLDLLAPLPYQILYALTGEYTAAAGSSFAANADRLLLSFTEEETVLLYLSDGRHYYRADGHCTYKTGEIAALANDSRLTDFTLTSNGVAACTASPHAVSLTLAASGEITDAQYASLLTLLGFRPSARQEGATVTAVDPHGTLRLTPTRMTFSASLDGGIPVSDLLDTAKDDLDIDLYDILVGSVSFTEQLRAILPNLTGGALEVYLKGFSYEDDTFTVTLGLHEGAAAVAGAYPHLVRLTVQSGRFRSVEVRFLGAERSGYTGTLFPSAWHFTHAAKNATLRTLRLQYRVRSLPAAGLDAAWCYTAESEAAK